MFGNLSATISDPMINYPISDSSLPFAEYIARCRTIIESRRPDLQQTTAQSQLILDANSPFELYPDNPVYSGKRIKYGVLLIHGLLDCPFSFHDIGKHLQASGMLCRAILLPGHGTLPSDLLSVTYHDWLQAVRYGVETLRNEVEEIFLVGYSTGAALSIYQSLQDKHIAGIVLLSPAIKVKAPVDIVFGWRTMTKWLSSNKLWLYKETENDYAKYLSVPFSAVSQVSKLTDAVQELSEQHKITDPMLMILSREDETISSSSAMRFFSSIDNQDNQLLLYTSADRSYADSRILTRQAAYPALNIKHISHIAIPFAPSNFHYGQHGDYIDASHINQPAFIYGAYNHIQVNFCDVLYRHHMIKCKRHELTYNPDFDFMVNAIKTFITAK